MASLDFDGVLPAIVTPFTADGDVDVASLESYVRWMKTISDVTGLVVNAHAGEGSSLTSAERADVIRRLKRVLGDDLPLIAGVAGDGSKVVAQEAALAAECGADALLVFPASSWLRFGYQDGAPVERFQAARVASGLPLILFQFPDETKAAYSLETLLAICKLDGVVAIKDGGRNMIRWDTEVPVIRERHPDIPILTCQDEFLLHTMWEADGALVGFAALVPELMGELLRNAKRHDYPAAKATYDRLTPLTKAVYHRTSHIESTAAMKLGLVRRGLIASATVRPPLMPLGPDAEPEIVAALHHAGVATS